MTPEAAERAACRFDGWGGIGPVGLVALGLLGCSTEREPPARAHFQAERIDSAGLSDPWGKGIGDVNGNGRLDLVVGSRGGDGLVWYENPGWRRHVISASGAWSTDVEVADMNADGHPDVVAIGKHEVTGAQDGLVLFLGPDWAPQAVAVEKLHDVSLVDLDGDGRLDIVGRGQAAFGGGGDRIWIYLQQANGGFGKESLPVEPGEGLAVADLDLDGWLHIIAGNTWLRNPGAPGGGWPAQTFSPTWTWPHTVVAVGDVNGDGRPDIVLTPAEREGEHYRISWLEQPEDPLSGEDWKEHVIASGVEAVHHSLVLADFDNDGRVDVATAMMQQGRKPQAVSIYFNDGFGLNWTTQVISREGSHNMVGTDVDGDGDVDLVGANWSGTQPVQLWRNLTCAADAGCPGWRRHEIDSARPGPAASVIVVDTDGDGLPDVATGEWWCRNPGRPLGQWQRAPIAGQGSEVSLLADLDGDGSPDALSVRRPQGNGPAELRLRRNDGSGRFRVEGGLPPVTGDFLQGVGGNVGTPADGLLNQNGPQSTH